MVGFQTYPQILDLGGSDWHWQNTLAYYNTAKITAIKSFIVQAPGMFVPDKFIKLVWYLGQG
jgi:hypothetical protein